MISVYNFDENELPQIGKMDMLRDMQIVFDGDGLEKYVQALSIELNGCFILLHTNFELQSIVNYFKGLTF